MLDPEANAKRKRDAVALAFAMLFPSLMAWLYFVVLARQVQERNLALLIAFGAGKCIQFGFPLLYILCFDRERFSWWRFGQHVEPGREIGLRAARRSLLLGGAFGLATAAAILIAYWTWLKPVLLAGSAPERIYHKLHEFGLASSGGFLLVATLVTVFHSLLEEYYWRWFVFGTLRKHIAMPAALTVSSLAFMAHHVIVLSVYFPGQIWTMAPPFSLAVAVGGGIWAWIYQRTGSLLGPWLAHVLTDAAIMIVGYDMIVPFL
jgi:uncharacterized protein